MAPRRARVAPPKENGAPTQGKSCFSLTRWRFGFIRIQPAVTESHRHSERRRSGSSVATGTDRDSPIQLHRAARLQKTCPYPSCTRRHDRAARPPKLLGGRVRCVGGRSASAPLLVHPDVVHIHVQREVAYHRRRAREAPGQGQVQNHEEALLKLLHVGR